MKLPGISVIIPVWNTGYLLRETVQSVLQQSYPDFELLLVDDGSTDALTLEILGSLEKEDERVSVIHRMNGGVSEARNTGVSLAKAGYIALLDHDDIWHCDKLAVQKKLLDENPQAVLVYSAVEPFGISDTITVPEYGEICGNAFLSELEQNKIHSTSCVMFRKDTVKKYEISFKKECVPCDDWDFYLQISRYGNILFSPDVPVKYRLHRQNQSADVAKMYRAGIVVLDRLQREVDTVAMHSGICRKKLVKIIRRHRAKHYRGLAYLAFAASDCAAASSYALQELSCRFSFKALAVFLVLKLKSLFLPSEGKSCRSPGKQ